MKTYNKAKIMRNAWYLKRIEPLMSFAFCLRKAWRSEKQAVLCARIEGCDLVAECTRSKETMRRPNLPIVPSDYYGVQGRYYGD